MLDHRDAKEETKAPPAPEPSSRHRAYVGPGERYDLMGATQFALLHALGLREHHKLLDFGCGSLRAGRLLIPYLGRGRYHGVEPNQWLVEAAIEHEIGRDLVALKSPHLHTRDDFRADRCGTDFDFILAQSIFSHTGLDLMTVGLTGFRDALAPGGLVAATLPARRNHRPADGSIQASCATRRIGWSRCSARSDSTAGGFPGSIRTGKRGTSWPGTKHSCPTRPSIAA